MSARQQQARIDLMIPVIKGWMTEAGVELASLGVQVHGGMGYVEETGAAQYWRDAHHADLRGHQRYSGRGPRGAQAGA
jgi:alkylation response protein AidB-like acyl-CoA dehydrogenase